MRFFLHINKISVQFFPCQLSDQLMQYFSSSFRCLPVYLVAKIQYISSESRCCKCVQHSAPFLKSHTCIYVSVSIWLLSHLFSLHFNIAMVTGSVHGHMDVPEEKYCSICFFHMQSSNFTRLCCNMCSTNSHSFSQ